MPQEEIRVALDLSDAIALIGRQEQQITALTTENKRLREALEGITKTGASFGMGR